MMNRLLTVAMPVCWGVQAAGIVIAASPVVAGALLATGVLGLLAAIVDVPGWVVAIPVWSALAAIAWRERFWPRRRGI